jgi:hypothetical protein
MVYFKVMWLNVVMPCSKVIWIEAITAYLKVIYMETVMVYFNLYLTAFNLVFVPTVWCLH